MFYQIDNMRTYIFLGITYFIFVFLYVSFISPLFGFLAPDLIVFVPLSLAYLDKKKYAYFSAFILGFYLDLFFGTTLGTTSLFLLICLYIYTFAKERIPYKLGVFGFFALLFSFMHYFLLARFLYNDVVSPSNLLLILLSNGLACFLVLWITSRLISLIDRRTNYYDK